LLASKKSAPPSNAAKIILLASLQASSSSAFKRSYPQGVLAFSSIKFALYALKFAGSLSFIAILKSLNLLSFSIFSSSFSCFCVAFTPKISLKKLIASLYFSLPSNSKSLKFKFTVYAKIALKCLVFCRLYKGWPI